MALFARRIREKAAKQRQRLKPKVEPWKHQQRLEGRPLAWRSYMNGLEAGERINPLQIEAGEHPEEAVPAEAGYRGAADKDGIKPEACAIARPHIRVAEQASGDSAGINGKCAKRLCRNRCWRRRGWRLRSAPRSARTYRRSSRNSRRRESARTAAWEAGNAGRRKPAWTAARDARNTGNARNSAGESSWRSRKESHMDHSLSKLNKNLNQAAALIRRA